MAILSREAAEALGFLTVGENVQVSDRASFYGANRFFLGSNVRIDDSCLLSKGGRRIAIGNHVHVAAYSSLIGARQIANKAKMRVI